MYTSDDWPPSAEEMIESPELVEAVRETDPEYFDDLLQEHPELAPRQCGDEEDF